MIPIPPVEGKIPLGWLSIVVSSEVVGSSSTVNSVYAASFLGNA
ncbi:hypothetical protein O3Q48_02535 [Enterococcus lactis]